MRLGLLLIGLLLGTGLWSQYEAPQLIIEGAGADDVAVIDLDSDGDQDVLVLKQDDHFHAGYWYENLDGQGNFDLPKLFDYFEDDRNSHLEIADLNGDGRLDIVTNTLWIENHGSINTFQKHIYSPGPEGYTYPVDMDNDGDLDLLRTGVIRDGFVKNDIIRWVENVDGMATFQDLNDFGDLSGPRGYKFINVLDFNADGLMDVIGSYSDLSTGDGGYIIWKNDNGGVMSLGIDQNTGDQSIFQIATGDVDADGFDEFATIERSQTNISNDPEIFYYKNTNGVFNNGSDLQSVGVIYGQIEFIDLDNQGNPGLVVLDDRTDNFHRFSPFNTSALLTGNTLPGAGGKGDFGDFDNDGKFDLAESSYVERDNATNPGDLYISKAVIEGTTLNSTEIIHHLREPLSETVADWDGSGSNDFISLEGGQTTKSIVWFSNDGFGNFADKIILNEDIGNTNKFWIVDVNQDGLNDIIADGPSSNVQAYLQVANGSLEPANDPIIQGSVSKLFLSDLDGNGTEDYIYFNSFSDELYWKANDGTLNGTVALLHPGLPNNLLDLHAVDLNNDNQNDIILPMNDGTCYVMFNNGSGNFSNLELAGTVNNANGFLGAHDLNQDGFADLTFNADSDLHLGSEKVVVLYYDTNTNSYAPEITLLNEDDVDEIQFTDIDGDGDLDIFTEVGHAINISGLGDYFFNATPDLENSLYAMVDASKDLDGDGVPDVVRDPYAVTTWLRNQYAGATALSGKVIIDENENCQEDNGEVYLSNVLVKIEKDATQIFANTSLQGYYGTLTPSLGDYQFTAIPPSPYWTSCETDTIVSVVDPDVDYEVDFHFQALVDCPLLSPTITLTRLRPCLPGAMVLNLCNYGTVDSEISQATLMIPPGIIVDSINYPVFSQTSTSIIFEIDPVAPGNCVGIFVFIRPDCTQLQVGDIVCTSVGVSPDDLCAPINLNWDESTIVASGTCVNDSVRFVLKNIGVGAMDSPREMRVQIINDDIIMFVTDTFQLDPSQEKVVTFLNIDHDAMRIEADQDPAHPVGNPAAALVENCQGLINDQWNEILQSFPQYNGDPFNDIACQTLTGSYDPNEKIAQPVGFGAEHLIQKNWPLDYTIYFQNTGNDTAFTVEIIDTISPLLDLATLRVANASHAFDWNIGPNNALTFTFENIILPDSNINLLGSQGFVKYTIRPKSDAAFNQRIDNRAAIYFDFNEPIITNTTFHTIQKPLYTSSDHTTLCAGESYENTIIYADTIIQELFEFPEYDSLAFHHIAVNESYENHIAVTLEEGDIYQGVVIEMDTTLTLETISINGCDSTVISTITVILSSDDETFLDQNIQVFPNPAKGKILATWNELPVTDIELYNVTGKLIQHATVGSNSFTLDLENCSAGVYHLRFKGSFGKVTKRFVKIN